MRMKQLSIAATSGVIWYVVCMRKVLAILQSWYGASVFLKIGMVFEGLQYHIFLSQVMCSRGFP